VTDTDVALLAAEADYIAELIDRGILPAGARREPTSQELRAGVRFAELDRIVVDAAALIVRATIPVRDHLLAHLDTAVRLLLHVDDGPYAVVAVLTDLTAADVPGLVPLVDAAVADIVDQLTATARAGADEAIGEATRQGVKATAIGPVDVNTDEVRDAATAHAGRIVNGAITRLLESATEGASRAAGQPGTAVLEAAVEAATETNGKL
jgi:hypothetical protein